MKDDLFFLMSLTRVKGLGSIKIKQLLRVFETAENVFKAQKKDLEKISGKIIASEIKNFNLFHLAEEEMNYTQRNNIGILSFLDADYPLKLKYVPDTPIILFSKGERNILQAEQSLSMVGTRMMTSYGKKSVHKIIDGIKDYNPVIVSGMAYGVDTESHQKALDTGLKTIAVMGTSFTQIYPQANQKLADRIVENGVILTEYWSYEKTDPRFFVKRNRIVAGISDGTVVVESGIKGGSLTTAEMAFSYNREVFAVPGRIDDVYSMGCNELIRKNIAQALLEPRQIPETLRWKKPEKEPETSPRPVQTSVFKDLSAEEQSIYDFLSRQGPEHLDIIALSVQMPVSKTAQLLMMMELNGVVQSLPGKRFRVL